MNGALDTAPRRMGEILAVAVALVVSVALIWLVTRQQIVVASYAGGLAVLGALAVLLSKSRPRKPAETAAMPDWSVTVAAIEQPGTAVAITDRANRLTCANSEFADAFGIAQAPPGLALGEGTAEMLTTAARSAWRDGSAAFELTEENGQCWQVGVTRAGRGDDHLVWRFAPLVEANPLAELDARLSGPFGQMLSQAGVEAALVGPEGVIRASSGGFAARAAGDRSATLAGQDFAALLKTDARDRIYFAREGKSGSPQTLVHVPLVEPGDEDLSPNTPPR